MANEEKLIPESEAIQMCGEITEKAAAILEEKVAEIKRLTKIEEDYKQLLTLVKVVAQQRNLAIDQHVEIKISKVDQQKSKSWEDLLQVHFNKRKSSLLIQV